MWYKNEQTLYMKLRRIKIIMLYLETSIINMSQKAKGD
jgi:hypothetical protein